MKHRRLVDLLGGRVEQFYALTKPVPTAGEIPAGDATIWAELLSTSAPDARVVLRYGKSNGWLDGQPAIITRRVGKGSITYIGACFDEKGMSKIARWMQEHFNLTTPLPGVPASVEVSQRLGADHVVHLLVNLSDAEQDVSLPSPMKDILQGGTVRQVHLAAYGVAVLDQPR